MALQVVTKKRFVNSLEKITTYLKKNWSGEVADDFYKLLIKKIDLISLHPNTGKNTTIQNTKSVLVGKGNQNKIFYRIEKNKLILMNMKDTRMNPKRNRYYQ